MYTSPDSAYSPLPPKLLSQVKSIALLIFPSLSALFNGASGGVGGGGGGSRHNLP